MVRPIMTHREIPKHKVRRLMRSRLRRSRIMGDNRIRRNAPKSALILALQKKKKFTFVKLKDGRVLRAGNSKIADKWLNALGVPEREVPFNYFGKVYIEDGFDRNTGIIYSYLGDRWHGSHQAFPTNRNTIIKQVGKTPNQLYMGTIARFNAYINLGYRVFFVWEHANKKGFMGRFYTGQGDTLY